MAGQHTKHETHKAIQAAIAKHKAAKRKWREKRSQETLAKG